MLYFFLNVQNKFFNQTNFVRFFNFSKFCNKMSNCNIFPLFSAKIFEKYNRIYVNFFKFSKSMVLDWVTCNEKVVNFNMQNKTKKNALILKQDISVLLYDSFFKTTELVDLTGVDLLGKAKKHDLQRFNLYYILNSYKNNTKYLINFSCSENSLVYSLNSLYPSIGWAERECWDMFGIRFRGNQDLRRILTDYGFRGFPLRKDFPVVGFKQVRFDELTDSVIYESLFLMQDERESVFVNPWSSTSNLSLSALSGVPLYNIASNIFSYFSLLNKI